MPQIGNVYTFNPSGLSVIRVNTITGSLADNLIDVTGVVEHEGTQTRGNVESPIWIVRIIDARLNTALPWEGVPVDTTLIVPEEAFRMRLSNNLDQFMNMIEANRRMLRNLDLNLGHNVEPDAPQIGEEPEPAPVATAPLTLGADPFEDFDARMVWGNTDPTPHIAAGTNEPGLAFNTGIQMHQTVQELAAHYLGQPTIEATVRPYSQPAPIPVQTVEQIRTNLMDSTPFDTRDIARGDWRIVNPASLFLMDRNARNSGRSLGTSDYEQRGRDYMFVLNTAQARVVFPVRNRISGDIAYIDREGGLWINEFSHRNVNNIFDQTNERCAFDDAARIRWCRLGFYHDMNAGERRTTQFISSKPFKMPRKKLYRKRPIPEIKDEKEYRSAKYIA